MAYYTHRIPIPYGQCREDFDTDYSKVQLIGFDNDYFQIGIIIFFSSTVCFLCSFNSIQLTRLTQNNSFLHNINSKIHIDCHYRFISEGHTISIADCTVSHWRTILRSKGQKRALSCPDNLIYLQWVQNLL